MPLWVRCSDELGGNPELDSENKCIYIKQVMTYDARKNQVNLRKHGLELRCCEEAFDAPMLTREDTRDNYGEARYVSLGWASGRVVVLVWTEGGNVPRLISCREASAMNRKPISERTRKAELPYNPASEDDTLAFWSAATAHTGVAEFKAKRGRPKKSESDLKEQIALRVDKEVLEWYRALGSGWQTRMNAVLKAYRDASV
ncbi:MAG TPA: BrnA antitoxin family protein [Accumulibacter sp.]|nr:BrnA antitoxin family protein [Accumulibacter sp.]HMX23035.1 BrnA antitoxin family protein [Accumulibacter sp.]HNJ99498.1 BrnA antitoxin family protein [Accumulibacter sp.]